MATGKAIKAKQTSKPLQLQATYVKYEVSKDGKQESFFTNNDLLFANLLYYLDPFVRQGVSLGWCRTQIKMIWRIKT